MRTRLSEFDCYNPVTMCGFFRERARAGAVRFAAALLLALLLWMPAGLLRADSVTVTITVDNGYGFGFGDQNGIYAGQYYGGIDNCTSAQIFGSPCYVFVPPDNPTAPTDTGAEIYNITAATNDYIYIVAWSDDYELQGTVASFTDNTTSVTVTTSPAWPWQVFATGTNWAPNCTGSGTHGPPLTGFPYAISNQIALANASAGGPGSSVTWVSNTASANGRLDFSGQYNGNVYPYAAPACIASGSLWMEYNPEPANPACNPFAWGSVPDYTSIPNFLREYLIYRIGPLGRLVSSNCLQVQCPTNKTEPCGTNWTFDPPTASSCCPNEFETLAGTLTNVLIIPTTLVTNGVCPTVTITQTWLITDGCGDTTNCSQTVTVTGCCTNCLQVQCPTGKTVQCGSDWTFDQPTASTCCTNEIYTSMGLATNLLITSTGIVTNGACPQLSITQTWQITDGCGDTTNCSQTVAVLGCCTNECCGPSLGAQTIQWLQLPTNAFLLPNPSGSNAGGTWIITNLPCYGNVLVVQDAPTNVVAICSNGDFGAFHSISSFAFAPNTNGSFDFTETLPGPYGPYSWGATPGALELGYHYPYTNSSGQGAPLPGYTVTFYFLDGQPDPCSLVFSAIGLAQNTTNTLSQPLTFRTEYDLSNNPVTYPHGPSADTMLGGIFGPPLASDVSGTVVGSAYAVNGGDDFNTGWAVLQPTNFLLTTNLPPGSGTDINGNPYPALNTYPYLTVTVNHELDDFFSLTVGYICCPTRGTNCFQVQCPADKTVPCGSAWTFDQPTASSCCPNEFYSPVAPPTNVLIIPVGFVTNGVCPYVDITETWLIYDGCGDSNYCSQTVTVTGCCSTNCINLTCPSNIVVSTCSNCVPVFYSARASNACCFSNVVLNYNPPSGACFPLGTNTVQVTAYDPDCASTPPATCSFTVTVVQGTNCCTNQCCGPNLGAQTINWLQLPTNGSTLVPDPSGLNGGGTWIITNLPCYGNVLVTQDPVTNVEVLFTKDTPFDNVPNTSGEFEFPMAGYGPYLWGTLPGWLDLYYNAVGKVPAYNVNFYFLDGPPNPCNLVLAVIAVAQYTTNTVSQPVTFRAEYDLTNSSGQLLSAYTMLGGIYGSALVPGVSGTVVASAYSATNVGNSFNTGFALFQPDAGLLTTNLPPGSGTDINGNSYPASNTYPYLTLTVNHQAGDSFGLTVGYICCSPCPTNCLQVQCPTNKTVPCGSVWAFDPPTAISCCSNDYDAPPGTTPTNVLITPTGTVTNGVCPTVEITETWLITDLCGDSTNCSQTVTVTGCCTNCLQVECPTNKTVQCGSKWTFDQPAASSCCASNFSGTTTNVLITSIGAVTNGVCPQIITNTWLISDACGHTTTCSQTVTVVDTTPPVINCPTNAVVVALNSNCQLVIPWISVTATDNCTPVCSLVYSQSPTNGTIVAGTSAYVTVTVTDLCGNSSHCVVLVEGVDRTGPVVTCPATMAVTNCLVPCVPVTATDNCCPQSSLTITQTPPCNTLLGPGINTVTVTVTDCHGNSTTKVVHLIIGGPESFLSNLTNTGVGPGGVLLPDDTVDPCYSLPPAAVPGGMPADYLGNAVAVSDICHATGNGCAWLDNYVKYTCYEYTPWSLPPDPAHTTAASKWIAPDYTNNGCCPPGNYTYKLNFVLPAGFNPSTATISGRWAADNAASMKLNGVPVPGLLSPGIAYWTSFTIPPASGFVSGANSLSFVVDNYGAWTGLRVEFTNAYANCLDCAPPVIHWITPSQSLQAGSTATFSVTAGGTPPFTYQWFHNNVSLAGDTNATLQLHSIGYSDAGLYSVVISNPCGVVTGYVRLAVTPPWWWQWGWWNLQVVTNPLAATVGPDLNLVGSGFATNYGIAAGTTEDFGLPGQGGRIVNVMDINPQAAASIEVPLIAPSGSVSDSSYTLIMDIYEPDTSLGTPSTIYQSIACCVSNLSSGGQDGVALTLDASNNLHIAGSASGMPFDAASAGPLPVDVWNRVALVVDNPQDGSTVTLSGFINGLNVIVIQPCICCVVPFAGPAINWTVSPPTLFSTPANAEAPNGEFYVSSIQFHDIALSSEMIAGIGSSDNGPAPANETSAGPPPVIQASSSNGVVNITWTASPYMLQETTDLSSGVWADSALPFTETAVNGNIVTTAVVTPTPSAPSKFYRLIFSP